MKKLFSIFRASSDDEKKRSKVSGSPQAQKQPTPKTQSNVQNVSEKSTSSEITSISREHFDDKVKQVAEKNKAILDSLPPNLPDDVIELAAINDAFLQGVLALQKMKLDDDLFLKAVNDLRKKYDNLREPYITKKIVDSQQADKEKQKRLLDG